MLTAGAYIGGRASRSRGAAALLLASISIVLLACLAVTPTRASAAIEGGALSQLSEPFACIGEVDEGVAKCGTSVESGLSFAYEIQVSPDGRNAYSVAVQGDLIEYSRDPANGALSVIGCFSSKSKAEQACETNAEMEVPAIESPAALAISPDGSSVYIVGQGAVNDLVEFRRNPETGLLTKIGCVAHGATPAECTTEAKGLELPYGVTVSPDGENVYVASFVNEAIAEFKRDPGTGELTQLTGKNNCISDTSASECGTTNAIGLKEAIGVVASGKDVYVGAGGTSAEGDIAAFERGTEGALTQLPREAACIGATVSGCARSEHLEGTEDLVVSPDGNNVYGTSTANHSVVELKRTATGALEQLASPNECVTTEKSISGCTEVKEIASPVGVAVSPDGSNVYVSSRSTNKSSVGAFARGGEGELAQLAAYPCVTEAASGCEPETSNGRIGLAYARRLTVSPDGANVYVASQSARAIVELARAPKRAVPPPSPSPSPEILPSVLSPPPIVGFVPSPVLAKTGNVAPVEGTVLVELPGTKTFVPLASLTQIPFGTIIEATHGTVSVMTANPNGTTQTGQFFDGQFILTQGKNGQVLAKLSGGNFSVCPTARERAHRARVSSRAPDAETAASGKHVVRKLWANAHGKFSTEGNYAAGAVQGTEWLTEDLCEGTLIRVTRDKVAVTNLVKHRRVEVKTGHKYLAKAP